MPTTRTAEEAAQEFDLDAEAVIEAAGARIAEMVAGPELAEQVRAAVTEQVRAAVEPIRSDAEASAARIEGLEAQVREQAKALAEPAPAETLESRTAEERWGADPHGSSPDAPGAALDGQFETGGEFLSAVLAMGRRSAPVVDPRLRLVPEKGDVAGALTGEDLSDGGALVPEEFRPLVMPSPLQPATIRGRARIIPMGSASITLHMIEDYDHSSGTVYGGIQVEWLEAGDDVAEGDPSFEAQTLTAKALAGMAEVGNVLIADSRGTIMNILSETIPEALRWKEERDFIRGNGAGKPLGVLQSDHTISLARSGADVLAKDHVDMMVSRLMPAAYMRAVWYAHPFMLQHISALTTGGEDYARADITDPMPQLLAGRPVFPNEHCSYPGTRGDIILADWMGYSIGDRQAVSVAASAHANFRRNATLLRVIARLDGQPTLRRPLSLAQGPAGDPAGAQVSCFVTLDDA